MKNIRLLIPCYRVRIGGKEYLLDAYFMSNLACIARRALMIYPPKGLVKVDAWVTKDSEIIEPAYSLNDALGMIREAYFWASEERLKRAKQLMSGFRLSFIIPAAMFRRFREDDLRFESELAGAVYIMEGVFGRRPLIYGLNPEETELTHVSVEIKELRDDDIVIESSNDSIKRAYRWLYINDEKFRERLRELVK